MFTNKHVVVALITAPILSVLAWFAVGNLSGERATPARPGQDYPLLAKSSCRWASGFCELENQDFALTLRYSQTGVLEVHSAHPLQGVQVSLYDPAAVAGGKPVALLRADSAGLDWRHPASELPEPGERLRLVVASGGSRYYGELSSRFAQVADNAIPNPVK